MGASHAHAGPWGGPPWEAIAQRALAAMSAHGRRHGKPFGRPGPWSWGPGGPGPLPPGFGPFGGHHFWGRGPKAKRGNVRAAVLALLTEEPRNGYQIIQAINERSGGAWKPSPGAVYPALSQLADEGLIRGEEGEGRKTFHLTDAGVRAGREVARPCEPPLGTAGPVGAVGTGRVATLRPASEGTAPAAVSAGRRRSDRRRRGRVLGAQVRRADLPGGRARPADPAVAAPLPRPPMVIALGGPPPA
jgi:DNA-binding PadR family transcriptional regulator